MWSPSKAAALRAAKRRPSVYPTIDLMPFVGVFMVLLFIFMTISKPLHDGMSSLDLPKAKNATLQKGAIREDAIRIAVTRHGHFYFDSSAAAPEDLPNLIRTAVRGGSEPKVYLFADSRARNGDVETVVDQIRLAGVLNVVVLASKTLAP